MSRRLLISLISAALLSGCLGSGTEPQPKAAEPQLVAQASTATESVDEPAPTVEQVVVERESPNISNQIDQLMGRLTLLQEQVINQRALAQQQLELSQAILQRVQLMTNTALIDETKPSDAMSETQPQSEQLDAALNQLLQIANEMQVNTSQQSVDSPWGVSSAVTSKGWILIRYRMDTGESWIAEKGSWTLLKEESTLNAGAYTVQIERRDTDSKGYVAVRLDRSSGATWWLNDRSWQTY